MSEIVEKVARAVMIKDLCGCTFGGERVFCDDQRLPDYVRNAECACKDSARAAIKATLEHLKANVSDQSVVAGDEKIIEFLNDHSFALRPTTPAQECFGAMISQAITELEI